MFNGLDSCRNKRPGFQPPDQKHTSSTVSEAVGNQVVSVKSIPGGP